MLRGILQVFCTLIITLMWSSPLWNTAQGQYTADLNVGVQFPNLSPLSQLSDTFSANTDTSGANVWAYIQAQQAYIYFLSGLGQVNSAARGFRHFRPTSFGPKLYPEGNLSYQPSEATRTPYTELNPKLGSGSILGTPGGAAGPSGH